MQRQICITFAFTLFGVLSQDQLKLPDSGFITEVQAAHIALDEIQESLMTQVATYFWCEWTIHQFTGDVD